MDSKTAKLKRLTLGEW